MAGTERRNCSVEIGHVIVVIRSIQLAAGKRSTCHRRMPLEMGGPRGRSTVEAQAAQRSARSGLTVFRSTGLNCVRMYELHTMSFVQSYIPTAFRQRFVNVADSAIVYFLVVGALDLHHLAG